MFVLSGVRFKKVYAGGIILIPTSKTNLKDFMKMEEEVLHTSVNVRKDYIQINLTLVKNVSKLDETLLYDMYIKGEMDETLRMRYKIHKIVLSEEKFEVECDDDLLDMYEIKELFTVQYDELMEKLESFEKDMVILKDKIIRMNMDLDNLNIISEINNIFDRNLLKNYI